jgi:hypothetical protein
MNILSIPLISSIVSLIFALVVLDQFFVGRKPYQLVWVSGLFMFFIGTGAEAWVDSWGLNQIVYRLWYLFGAIFVAAYLGMGTLYLLAPRRLAHSIMVILLVASFYAVFRVFTVSINLSNLSYLSGSAMPQGVRLMTPFFNIFGTILLVGGALYSAWVYWKRKVLPYRVISNVLIAVGAIMPALGGILMRFNVSLTAFYLLELLGIIIIFIGFLRSQEVFTLYRVPLIHGLQKVVVNQR